MDGSIPDEKQMCGCADTVADILVENIILQFGMPLVIHSDQGREFENGLMKSLENGLMKSMDS